MKSKEKSTISDKRNETELYLMLSDATETSSDALLMRESQEIEEVGQMVEDVSDLDQPSFVTST
jgi:hypothetical protein